MFDTGSFVAKEGRQEGRKEGRKAAVQVEV
jgi:hypothetical protein